MRDHEKRFDIHTDAVIEDDTLPVPDGSPDES
jgi:hypothetical protein